MSKLLNVIFKRLIKILFIFIYSMITYIMWLIFTSLIINVQIISLLIFGKPIKFIKNKTTEFTVFFKECLDYILQNIDKKPFPFSTWPDTNTKTNKENNEETINYITNDNDDD